MMRENKQSNKVMSKISASFWTDTIKGQYD